MTENQNAMVADYNPVVYTRMSTIPQSGAITYNGYLSGSLSNTSDVLTDTMVGALEMDIAFNGAGVTVSGRADGFRDSNGRSLTGELTLSSGDLDRDGDPNVDPTFTLSADGTLVDHQGRNLVFGTHLEGDFLGTSHNAVGGDALGRVTYNGTSQDFDGIFIAER